EPHIANLSGVVARPARAERRLVNNIHRVLGSARCAMDHAGFAQGLAFPKLGAGAEVLEQPIDREGERTALAGRPEPRVDFVEPAVGTDSPCPLDDPLP